MGKMIKILLRQFDIFSNNRQSYDEEEGNLKGRGGFGQHPHV